MRTRTLGLVSAAVLTPFTVVLAVGTIWLAGQWLDEKATEALIYPETPDDDYDYILPHPEYPGW